MLKGAELKAGQFSFELKSRDGKVMSTAKNAADGSVTFDALTFKQAGTYTFTVSEVDDGQVHVTYDKAVHKIVDTVSDERQTAPRPAILFGEGLRGRRQPAAGLHQQLRRGARRRPPAPPRTPARRGAVRAAVPITVPAAALAATDPRAVCPTPATAACRLRRSAAMAGIGALAVAGGAACTAGVASDMTSGANPSDMFAPLALLRRSR